MARAFTKASNHRIQCAIGALSGNTFGTFAVICKRASDYVTFWGGLIEIASDGGATAQINMAIQSNDSGNNIVLDTGSSISSGLTVTTADGWVLVVAAKATGTSTVNFWRYVYATDTWSTAAPGTFANWGTGDTVNLGASFNAGDAWDGDIQIAAIWNRALSDAEVRTLPFSLQGWYALSPSGLWLLDQSDVGQAIGDLTGGGANQSGITGTSVSANSMALWNYGVGVLPVLRAIEMAPASEAPPVLIGTGSASFTATNAATLSPGLPSGWAVGDIHILIAARSDNTAMTSLTGWTQLYAQNNTTAQRVEVWWRRAEAGDAAPTVTFGSGTVVRGAVIIGVRGAASSGNPFDVTSLLANAASATASFTDVTTTGPNRLILAALAYEDDPTTLTTMTDFLQASPSVFTSALGTDMMLGYEHRTLAAQGAAGASSLTVSGGTFANSVNVGVVLALRPDQTLLNMVELRGRPAGLRGQTQQLQLLAQ